MDSAVLELQMQVYARLSEEERIKTEVERMNQWRNNMQSGQPQPEVNKSHLMTYLEEQNKPYFTRADEVISPQAYDPFNEFNRINAPLINDIKSLDGIIQQAREKLEDPNNPSAFWKDVEFKANELLDKKMSEHRSKLRSYQSGAATALVMPNPFGMAVGGVASRFIANSIISKGIGISSGMLVNRLANVVKNRGKSD